MLVNVNKIDRFKDPIGAFQRLKNELESANSQSLLDSESPRPGFHVITYPIETFAGSEDPSEQENRVQTEMHSMRDLLEDKLPKQVHTPVLVKMYLRLLTSKKHTERILPKQALHHNIFTEPPDYSHRKSVDPSHPFAHLIETSILSPKHDEPSFRKPMLKSKVSMKQLMAHS